MARPIQEIKQTIINAFLEDSNVKTQLGYDDTKSWSSNVSKASIINLLFYAVAASIWLVESLFDYHRTDMQNLLQEQKPHTLSWYRSKTLAFMFGKSPITDTDKYDTTGMTDDEIEAAKVVKYAAVNDGNSVLYIKVSTETAGVKSPLSDEHKNALQAYLNEVKDAGVSIQIINEPAADFSAEIDIYYDAMILSGTGLRLFDGTEVVKSAIENHISSMPFNGWYTNQGLVDALQKVPGVILAEIKFSKCKRQSEDVWTDINAKIQPYSGYMQIADSTDIILNFIPNE